MCVCVCETAESRNEIFTHSPDARFRNSNKDCVSFLVTEKVSMLFERHRHCGNLRHPQGRLRRRSFGCWSSGGPHRFARTIIMA